jgi:Zn-dependent peptidase ImmA (M78 family)
MTKYEIDEYGIPILSGKDIDKKAEEVIKYFDETLLRKPQRTPILEFVDSLKADHGLHFDFNANLGTTSDGIKILGKTILKPLMIFVDQSVVNGVRFESVLGHELGHVVFHRKVNLTRSGYSDGEFEDSEIDFTTGKKILKTPRDRIEWHAKRFSAAILMPRSTVPAAVIEKQREIGINPNRMGPVILDNTQSSKNDFNKIRSHLHLIYGASVESVEYRLSDLGWLIDHRDFNCRHISALFSTE